MSIWQSTPEATNFIMSSLIMGDQFPKKKTIVKVIYDNDAIYVAALLYDDEPIRLEKRFHNGTVLLYQTFFAFHQWL
jgi:hypothetical protein